MSMTKSLCSFVATVCVYRSCTPPNPTIKSERVSRKNVFDRWVHSIQYVNRPFNILVCVIGFAEVAAIIASYLPSWAFSEHIVSMLLARRNPQDLQFTPFSMMGLLLIVAGSTLREYCYRSLRRLFTFDVTIRKGHKLITTGPYGFVRHPSYTGLVAVFFGSLLWYGSRGSWVRESGILETTIGKGVIGFVIVIFVVAIVGLLGRMRFEDAELRKTFGREWEEWAQRVPCFLIPGVY
ncbi:hypothetical protein BDZ94DRAFT_1214105 [Collybia nuda]|uniref:Protein-S-isoprenylcysteine O-methyltransferase n=1 Tax=Collybia nuda TaxID=64659 RepID=A0A9P5YBP7_9AGAR|nr:hypothetical protein BDZ94DRAFT_1214105 [Collybia nuda]